MTISTAMTTISNQKIAIIIAAAGSSTRMNLGCKKEYLPIQEGTVLSTAAKAFLKTINISSITVTVPKNGKNDAENAFFADSEMKTLTENVRLHFIEGGKTRQESVFNALKSLEEDKPSVVLIHDGARPFVSSEIIRPFKERDLFLFSSSDCLRPFFPPWCGL